MSRLENPGWFQILIHGMEFISPRQTFIKIYWLFALFGIKIIISTVISRT